MPHKLLLADDSVTIQRVIELTFADEDVQVVAVGNGQQAIERIEAERPDIVLADIGMPGRDGYEVAAHVKHTSHLAHIPVVLLTGAFEPIDEARANAVGCNGVLAKPFEPQIVISRVKDLLAGIGRPADAPQQPPPATAGDVHPEPAGAPVSGAQDAQSASHGSATVHDSEPPTPSVGSVRAGSDQAASTPAEQASSAPESSVHPEPSAERDRSGDSLDEYFDRLDAAFASLHAFRPAVRPVVPPHSMPPLDVDTAVSLGADDQPASSRALGQPVAPELAAAPEAPDLPTSFAGPPPEAELAATPPGADALAASPESATDFGAASPAAAAPPMTDELVDDIVSRVIARMSDHVVRETVTELVSRIAERLVREEIERIKATSATS